MFDHFFSLWNNRDELRAFISIHPYLGIVVFIALQVLQVVIAPLPGEATGFLAGFFFGAFKGLIISMIGIIIGSSVAFYIAKACEKKWLKKYEKSPIYLKIKKIFKKHGLTGVFILYLFPGFPKDLLNYFLGFMPITFKAFITICALGRIPATFALTLQGDVVYKGEPKKILISSAIFVIAFLTFLLIKKRIYSWLENNATT